MIDPSAFIKPEVAKLIAQLAAICTQHRMGDAARAMAVIQAFIIDSAKDKDEARTAVIEAMDYALLRAKQTNAMETVNRMMANAPPHL